MAGGDAAAGGIKLAVQFPGSADINPVQYVQGLAKAVAARGGRIFEHSRVKVTGDNKCVGAPFVLVTAAWGIADLAQSASARGPSCTRAMDVPPGLVQGPVYSQPCCARV